jgi:hypothetical protein
VTVVRQDSSDKYTVVATVDTFPGAKTITVDTKTHNVYLFQPERGPVPPGTPPPAAGQGGRGRGPQGSIVASWFNRNQTVNDKESSGVARKAHIVTPPNAAQDKQELILG